MKETRIKKIFDILTESKEILTSEEIALKLDCSSRTIRDEIKKLNKILLLNGAKIEVTRSSGCSFKIVNSDDFEKFLAEKWNKYAFYDESYNNPENRVKFILRYLLFSSKFIKAQSIIDELNISRSLFNRDLRKVKEIIKKFNLKIVSKPYLGIKIDGCEFDKRLCIANSLYKEIKRTEIFRTDHTGTIEKIKKIVIDVLRKERYETTEISFYNLVIHLYITIKRIENGEDVSVSRNELIRLESKDEYIISKKLTYELSKHFNIEFPREEVAYISIHLLSKKINLKHQPHNIPAEVEEVTRLMIDRITNTSGVNLRGDLELKLNLALHLVPLIERIKYKLVLKNPILDEIRKDVKSFKAAIEAVKVIEDKYNVEINSDEIGYIALHISVAISRVDEKRSKKNVAIVCGSGVGTANLMKYQFIREYGCYINKIVTFDYISLNEKELNEYDIIITSIPLDISINKPIVEVGVYLNDEDIKTLDKYISCDFSVVKFRNIFDKNLYFKDVKSLRTKEEVMFFIS